MEDTFRWLSPLGMSVGMFLAMGALWIFVGALTVPLHDRSTGAEMLFVSPPTDRAYFGAPPSEILKRNPEMAKFRTLLLTVIAGFLMLSGSTFMMLAWFGLRRGQSWALAALGIGCLVAVAWWALALQPYFRLGVRVTLGDLPPFMWIPAMLILQALVLGWLGLR